MAFISYKKPTQIYSLYHLIASVSLSVTYFLILLKWILFQGKPTNDFSNVALLITSSLATFDSGLLFIITIHSGEWSSSHILELSLSVISVVLIVFLTVAAYNDWYPKDGMRGIEIYGIYTTTSLCVVSFRMLVRNSVYINSKQVLKKAITMEQSFESDKMNKKLKSFGSIHEELVVEELVAAGLIKGNAPKGKKRASLSKIVKELMLLFGPQKLRLFFVVCLIAVNMVATPLYSTLIGNGIDIATRGELPSGVICGFFATWGVQVLAQIINAYLIAILFANGSIWIQRRLMLRGLHLESLTGEVMDQAGAISSSFSQGLSKAQAAWMSTIYGGIGSYLSLLLQLCFALSVNVPLALFLLSSIFFQYSVQIIKAFARKYSTEFSKELTKFQSLLANYLGLRDTIKVFEGSEEFLEKRWDLLSVRNREIMRLSFKWGNILQLSYVSVNGFFYVVALVAVLLQLKLGIITASEAIQLTGYATGLKGPINSLAAFNNRIVSYSGPIHRLFVFCCEDHPRDKPGKPEDSEDKTKNMKPELTDPDSDTDSKDQAKNASLEEVVLENKDTMHRGGVKVEVHNFTFQYPSATKPTLCGLDFLVEEGRFVALVGASGSGKSTLLKLLAKIEGLNQAKPDSVDSFIKVDSLQPNEFQDVSMVLQHTEGLLGTIFDNIWFGSKTKSLESVMKSAQEAELHPAIMQMSSQYDSELGESAGEVQLSGGQMARLGLARALNRRPKLLILDEITSPLDPATEDDVLKTLKAINKSLGCTIIMCTHSVPALKYTDEIFMLAEGKLLEHGTFEELEKNKTGEFFKTYCVS